MKIALVNILFNLPNNQRLIFTGFVRGIEKDGRFVVSIEKIFKQFSRITGLEEIPTGTIISSF